MLSYPTYDKSISSHNFGTLLQKNGTSEQIFYIGVMGLKAIKFNVIQIFHAVFPEEMIKYGLVVNCNYK